MNQHFYLTDNYIYNFIEKYTIPHLCFLKPDYVSLIRIIPILFIYKSIKEQNKIILFISIISSIILDFYDGLIARKCNKTTKFGGELDLFMDLIHYTVIIYYIINLYFPNIKNKGLLVISIILIINLLSRYIFDLNNTHVAKNYKQIYDFLSLNTILLGLSSFYVIQRKFN